MTATTGEARDEHRTIAFTERRVATFGELAAVEHRRRPNDFTRDR
jgi:hypothetical protein